MSEWVREKERVGEGERFQDGASITHSVPVFTQYVADNYIGIVADNLSFGVPYRELAKVICITNR